MRKIIAEESVCPIIDANQIQGTDRLVLDVPRHEVIDADTLQAAAEIELGRVV